MEPALTTIHFPAEEIGGLAGREMCGLIAQSEGSENHGAAGAQEMSDKLGRTRNMFANSAPATALICEIYCTINGILRKTPGRLFQ